MPQNQHQCPHCELSYTTKKALDKHIRNRHTGDFMGGPRGGKQ